MNKVSLSIHLLLLCLVTMTQTQNIPDYKPIAKLDWNKVVDRVWYQIFWADNVEWEPTACHITWYHRVCPNKPDTIWYLNAYHDLNPQGKLNAAGGPNKVNPEVQGELRMYIYNDVPASYYILEHASDYSWMIRANTYVDGGFIDLVSRKTTVAQSVTSRALALAEKYNLKMIHWLQHGDGCDYKGNLQKLKNMT